LGDENPVSTRQHRQIAFATSILFQDGPYEDRIKRANLRFCYFLFDSRLLINQKKRLQAEKDISSPV